MRYPNFREEKKLWRRGYKYVVGLDEAGRGPLAGPVVAAAVMLKIFNFQFSIFNKFSMLQFSKIRDSKKLIPKKREEFYKLIMKSPFLEWGIGRVSEKVIDKINILEATKLAMVKAIKELNSKFEILNSKQIRNSKFEIPKIDFLIIDGNFTLPAEALAKAGIDKSIPQKSIVKGDNKVFSIAAASILAKVYRDRIMERYDKKYPRYGFSKHKGYPTRYHIKMLKKYGPCKIHRKTFKPVKKILNPKS